MDILTKGDNNQVDDRGLYAASQSWINKEHVIGRAKGYLPYVRALARALSRPALCSFLSLARATQPFLLTSSCAVPICVSVSRRLGW